jgi:tRNA (guanine-N7-)-methyltransferase
MSSEQNSFPRRTIKSYVIRAGRMTTAQTQALEQHLPRLGLTVGDTPWELNAIFSNAAPYILEIGFGMGSSLFTMAQQYPNENFIGVEVHKPGVGALLAKTVDAGLTNLRVCMADAKDVLAHAIPNNSLARVQIFFPDPWHKTRHHKRRLIQMEFVNLIHQKLQPGGILHIATDWQPYAEHIIEVMQAVDGYKNTATHGEFVPCPAYRPLTKYETRGQRLGHEVFDIVFAKAV